MPPAKRRPARTRRPAKAAGDTPVVEARLDALRPHPANPRTITADRLEQLMAALDADRQMLQARPLIALPDGTVIAGNQRLAAARELGWETIPTVFVDLDERRAQLWALRDNNQYGEWDQDALAELVASVATEDLDLTGFASVELDQLLEHAAGGDGDPPPPGDGSGGPVDQYGVIVLCEDEAHQARVYEELSEAGHDCKVVTT